MSDFKAEINSMVKKHKKLFESYSFNPGGIQINGCDFYLANYERFNKITGCAVLSPHSPSNKKDYSEAFNLLYDHAQYMSLLYIHGGFRAGINMDSFKTVNAFIHKVKENIPLEGEQQRLFQNIGHALDTILDLQGSLIEQYNQYYERSQQIYTGNVAYVTKEDILGELDLIGEVEYIQYTQLTIQYDAIDDFHEMYDLVKENDEIAPYLEEDTKVYFREFIRSKSSLKSNIEKVTYEKGMQDLPKDQFKELVKKETKKNVNKIKAGALQKLRFPK